MVGVFVVGLTLFSAVAKIDSAVVAPGMVRVGSQPQDGPPPARRHGQVDPGQGRPAREGQDQVLLIFDEVQPKATNDVLQNQQDALLAQSARFQAEATGQLAPWCSRPS